MKNNNLQIDGYFINFSNIEIEKINNMLLSFGYTPDSDGIKNYLLDSTENVFENNIPSRIEKFILENPETINTIIQLTKKFFNKKR